MRNNKEMILQSAVLWLLILHLGNCDEGVEQKNEELLPD